MSAEEGLYYYQTFKVDRLHASEFAHSIGLESDVYYDKLAAEKVGYSESIVAPTFLTAIDYANKRNLQQFFNDYEIDVKRLIHGEQSYEYFEDIYVGDRISVEVYVAKVEEKNEKIFYYLETRYTNQLDEKVAKNKTTFILLK